jgi:hypothetical protein
MACYDCEDCSKSIEYGGNCKHFEYNCPFTIVEKYDSEKLKSIRNAIEKILKDIEQLTELDNEEYMEDEISSVKFQLSLLLDKVDEDIEKEWNEIR